MAYRIFLITLCLSLNCIAKPLWAAVEVVSGGNQTLTVGAPSADIVFRFVDESGTTLLTNAAVSFVATDAAGQALTNALSVNNAITDLAGIAATRLNAGDLIGEFTITAQLTNNANLAASTSITVEPAAGFNITSGGAQVITVGFPSEAIVFSLLDANLNPIADADLIFALFNAAGDSVPNGLIITNIDTDSEGVAVTRANAITATGTYTITARLLEDATVSASTTLTVISGGASVLNVTAGNNQSLPAGRDSDAIQFEVSDGFGNPVTNRAVNFTLVTPSGENTVVGLSPAAAVTDLNGRVTTRFNATQIQSNYRIIATLVENNTVRATATLTITAPLAALPSLGFGGAVSSTGAALNTTATFNGGVSVNEGMVTQEVVYAATDNLEIKGTINVDPTHVGQLADLLLVVAFTPPQSQTVYLMLNSQGTPLAWDGNIASLVAFRSGVILERGEELELYMGRLGDPGVFQVFFGYRLGNGTVIYNIEHVIGLYLEG